MQPTINRDFTPAQIKRYNEQKASRKEGEPIEMQCLTSISRGVLSKVRITVWKASIIERLKIAISGKVYLTMSGKPMVWLDINKPYKRNELIQNVKQPDRGEQKPKKVTAIGGLDKLTADDVSERTERKARGGA